MNAALFAAMLDMPAEVEECFALRQPAYRRNRNPSFEEAFLLQVLLQEALPGKCNAQLLS